MNLQITKNPAVNDATNTEKPQIIKSGLTAAPERPVMGIMATKNPCERYAKNTNGKIWHNATGIIHRSAVKPNDVN